MGCGATALWRAAERGLPGLPVHRCQPTGDRHAGVFPSEDPVSQFTVGPAGTHSSGQSTTLALTKLISRYSFLKVVTTRGQYYFMALFIAF